MTLSVGFIVENPYHGDLGFSIRTRELSLGLAKLGCQVHVFTPVDKEGEKPYPNIILHSMSGKTNSDLYRMLREYIRKLSKSKTFGRLFYLNATLSFISDQSAKMVLKVAQGIKLDVLQGTQATTSSVAIKIGKKLGIPTIAGMGAVLVEEAVQADVFKENSLYYKSSKKFVNYVLTECSALICASESMKELLIRNYGATPDKVEVIPNGANPVSAQDATEDMTKISHKNNSNNATEDKKIIYAGILDLWERVDLLIESMPYVLQKFPQVKLLIVGEGRLKHELIELVEKRNLKKNISFLGLKPRNETFEIMATCDVAVLPSSVDLVRKVACPIKLFDYMSVGLPIVTVDVGWWSDIVRSRNTGFVTQAEPRSFGGGICKALEDKKSKNIYGNNGKQVIATEFNWLDISRKLMTIYKNTIDR
jgi:glycosyltransferase involved in cell wall biosynthesis